MCDPTKKMLRLFISCSVEGCNNSITLGSDVDYDDLTRQAQMLGWRVGHKGLGSQCPRCREELLALQAGDTCL
jgi:hypothetical protein